MSVVSKSVAALCTGGAVLGLSLAIGVVAINAGDSRAAVAAAAADEPGSIVEDFNYPGAAAVLEERGIKLVRGDGRIMLTSCGATPNNPPADVILVQSNDLTLPNGTNFCFKATGTTGYLAMEIPQVYFVRGDNARSVSAVVEVQPVDPDEQVEEKTETVEPGEWQPVGVGASEGDAVLLELRYPIGS